MTNAHTTTAFLAVLDANARADIVACIAAHYGISNEEVYSEITGEDAEHLLDYMTGRERAATSVLMQRHGFST